MAFDADASLKRRHARFAAARSSALLFAGLFGGLLLLAAVFVGYRNAVDWVDHTREVITTVQRLQVSLADAETGQRGYLLTRDNRYLQPYDEGRVRSRTTLDSLGALTADNPTQQSNVAALRTLADAKLDQMALTLARAEAEGMERALAMVREGTGERLMGEIRERIALMKDEETRLLSERSGHARLLETLTAVYGLLFAGTAIGIGRSTMRRLEQDYQAERAEGEALAIALQQNTTLLDEVNHRVKNSLQVVSNLLRTQALKHPDDAVRKELLDSSSRVNAIAEVHRRLYGKGATYDTVELSDLLRSIAEGAAPLTCTVEHRVDMTLPDAVPLPVHSAVPVALIVNELLTNTYKHAHPDGRAGTIRMAVTLEAGTLRIAVADDGVGLPEGIEHGEGGFGLNMVRILTRQLKGVLEIGRPPSGTLIALSIPYTPDPQAKG